MTLPIPQMSEGLVASALAQRRLGVAAVVAFSLVMTTPLTVVAGVTTTGWAATGRLVLPAAFVAVGVVLIVFSVGYTAMARRVGHAGAFYAYISCGLHPAIGVGAAWVALLAYNALQIGLYGAIGAAAGPLVSQWLGLSLPWWTIALLAWAATACLGLMRVDVNGRVLAMLLVAEVLVIVIFSVANVASPVAGITADALNMRELFAPGLGALLTLAVLGFVGFEAAVVFSEESRSRSTVTVATFISVAVTGALYTFAGWAMTVAVGPGRVVDASRDAGPDLLFNLAYERLGQTATDIGRALFATSILAALIGFHHTVARYTFALGRERVLSDLLSATSSRSGAPVAASVAQSCVGLVVIVVYATAGGDPVTDLFYLYGATGGLGVLGLITLASIAVPVYFARTDHDESPWTTYVVPVIAAVTLCATFATAITNLPVLFGVEPGHPITEAVPYLYLNVMLLGIGWALILRIVRPHVYAAIGRGGQAPRTPLADDPSRGMS
jgi:amino acid transporter